MTDDAEDDGLKSLRAVWLSMPDEDPPERGLADLMAAARVKAVEMAKPTLWQRLAQALRRPPVLALATVTVLIGGAVLVGGRDKNMDAQPTVSAPTGENGTARVAAADEVRGVSAGPSAGSAGLVAATPAAPSPAEPQAEQALEVAVGGADGRGGPEQQGAQRKRASESQVPTHPRREALKNEAKAPVVAKDDSGADFESTAGILAADEDVGVQREKSVQDKTTATTSATTGAASGKGHAASPPPQIQARDPAGTQTVAQLHEQARAAAARGDCESVRRAVRTIATKDAQYYNRKVARDPTLACTKR